MKINTVFGIIYGVLAGVSFERGYFLGGLLIIFLAIFSALIFDKK